MWGLLYYLLPSRLHSDRHLKDLIEPISMQVPAAAEGV